jgi:hypothetical protein
MYIQFAGAKFIFLFPNASTASAIMDLISRVHLALFVIILPKYVSIYGAWGGVVVKALNY